ncbi:hypothetical protein LXL04_028167 [Taraxacum kok-saghyz]
MKVKYKSLEKYGKDMTDSALVEDTRHRFSKHGEKWRTWKGSLKTRGYDRSLTIDEIMAQQTKNVNR